MHRSLFSTRTPRLNEYYKGMKDLSKPEDQYLYLVAHEFKHYSTGGNGLRSLLDTYLFLKKETLDWEYVEEEAGKLGIRGFEKNNRRLAAPLFQSGAVTDEKMLSYILNSSAYGNFEHRVDNKLKSSGGNRVLYTLKRSSVRTTATKHLRQSILYSTGTKYCSRSFLSTESFVPSRPGGSPKSGK